MAVTQCAPGTQTLMRNWAALLTVLAWYFFLQFASHLPAPFLYVKILISPNTFGFTIIKHCMSFCYEPGLTYKLKKKLKAKWALPEIFSSQVEKKEKR